MYKEYKKESVFGIIIILVVGILFRNTIFDDTIYVWMKSIFLFFITLTAYILGLSYGKSHDIIKEEVVVCMCCKKHTK